jgi:N-acetylglucosaminyldiphosphoundecaprenol N-acetyl-beta-D-mannosaminyltransferase
MSGGRIFGVRIDRINKFGVLETIRSAALEGRTAVVNNVNIHALNLAYTDPEFKQALNRSDVVFVDGVGVKWGAHLSGIEVGDRITPADLIDELLAMCATNSWPIFLLGDTHEIAQKFANKLSREHPSCQLAGTHHGFFEKWGDESLKVVEKMNNSNAKILLLAMSMPIQEKWQAKFYNQITIPVRMSVGGLPRIYTGVIARGPRWMTDNGLEWLYRLAVQRRKVWRRYVIGNPLFLMRVIFERLGWRSKS